MYVSLRDLASLTTISVFLAAMFTWADILQTIA
jgi:hypothetical protein